MERDYGKEIDGLRTQLDDVKNMLMEIVTASKKGDGMVGLYKMPDVDEKKPQRNIHPMERMHPDKRVAELMAELCVKAENDGNTGAITYLGVFASGNRQSNWIRHQVETDSLLKLIESNTAAKVLACIGNNDRLNMLLALLRESKTVAGLVEECGYNTTGQVYHHLKPLLAADLVKEDDNNRGSYVIQPHRVQGIIMLLAGISDMLDPYYTQGSFEPTA